MFLFMNIKKNLLFIPLAFASVAIAEPSDVQEQASAIAEQEQVIANDSSATANPEEKTITEKDIEPITNNLQELQANSDALKQEIETLKATIEAQNKASAEANEKIAKITEEQAAMKAAEQERLEIEEAKKAAEAAKAKEEVDNALKVLHGNAYNASGNVAAQSTIGGDLAIPHKMYGHKLAYMEPINENGVIAFGQNTTYFMSFDSANELGVISIGSTAKSFGFSLEAALGKKWQYKDYPNGGEENSFTTKSGHMYGATASMLLGNIDVALKGQFVNPELEEDTTTNIYSEKHEIKHEIWDAKGKLVITNTSNPAFAWEFDLNFLRHNAVTHSTEKNIQHVEDGKDYLATYKKTQSDTSSRIEIVPELKIGAAVLESGKSRVLLGLNTKIPYMVYDRIDGICSRNNQLAVFVKPNVLAETALSKYLIVFGSVDYELNLVSWRDSYINEEAIKSVEINSGTTTVNFGARIAYEQLAMEMGFTKQFLKNPFHAIDSEDDIAVNIGAMLSF